MARSPPRRAAASSSAPAPSSSPTPHNDGEQQAPTPKHKVAHLASVVHDDQRVVEAERSAALASLNRRTPVVVVASSVAGTAPRPTSTRRESLRTGRSASIDWTRVIMTAVGGAVGEDDFDKLSRDEVLHVFQKQYLEMEELKSKVTRLEEDQETLVNENGDILRELEGVRASNADFLNEQSRMEEELAGRIEVLDKLRTSVRDLEREKRDATKRYRDQADSFDSERLSWYDQEAHYKGRIANLTSASARRTPRSSLAAGSASVASSSKIDEEDVSGSTAEDDEKSDADAEPTSDKIDRMIPSPVPSTGPSTNELALHDQLATLSTAHESLTTTLRAVQIELSDLKRVYQYLQEENESYEILLGEKTLSGEVRGTELFRRSFQWGDEGGATPGGDGLGFLGGLETLGEEKFSDDEEDEEDSQDLDDEDVERVLLETQGTGSCNEGAVQTKNGVKRRTKKRPSVASGGGGLDLAAELEMAQAVDQEEEERKAAKVERRRASDARKAKAALEKRKDSGGAQSNEDLQKEVKALREANKALTLYVSKIVDRVCSQEGFEKVLAVDYRNVTPKVSSSSTLSTTPAPAPAVDGLSDDVNDGQDVIKFRPTSIFRGSSTTGAISTPSAATSPMSGTAGGKKGWGDAISSVLTSALSRTPQTAPTTAPGMKPLRLSLDGSARKLSISDEVEDEDDLRERERLRQEMARIGLSSSGSSSRLGASPSAPATPSGNGGGGNTWIGKMSTGSDRSSSARLSIGSTTSSNFGDSPSTSRSANTNQTTPPTPKDLEAEVQEVLQLRVVKEKQAKAALEQGKASGFTEPQRRMSQRPTPMQHTSRSSVSYIVGGANPIGVGLGIDAGLTPPAKSPSTVGSVSPKPEEAAPSSPTGTSENETPAPWGKAIRRLSMGWSSPNPSG